MALDQIDADQYSYDPNTGELKALDPASEMSFFDHLEELRWHIIKAVLAVVICFIILFVAKDFVYDDIVLAPMSVDFWSYKLICNLSHNVGLGARMCFEPVAFDIVQIELGEKFFNHIKVSFVLGFVLAFPFVFREIWGFIKPGLYPNEQKAVRGIVFICSLLFFTGILFGYYVIAPFAINFLAGYDLGQIVTQVSITSFVNFMVMFTLPAGLVFELPIVVYFLSKVGLLTPSFMRTYRRHAIIIILMLAALITPPDIVTQFLIGIPLYILYELSIFICAREYKKYEKSLTD